MTARDSLFTIFTTKDIDEVTRQKTGRPAPRAHAVVAALERGRFSQRPPGAAGPARSQCRAAHHQRLPLRRQPPGTTRPAALDQSDRGLVEKTRLRLARHVARSFHGVARNGWTARVDRPGMGRARFASAARRAETIPAGPGRTQRNAAHRPRACFTRSLRPSGL